MTPAYASIRECREADLARFGELGSPRHIQHCRQVFERMQRGETLILVAVDEDDAPVGKLHIDLAGPASERTATIEAAAVTPSLQGRGIGTALMEAAEALIRDRGLVFAELGVEDANPHAARLYDRLGYRPIGEETFSYEVDGPAGTPTRVSNPGVRMRKRLAPDRPGGDDDGPPIGADRSAMVTDAPQLLAWARSLQAIAQSGLAWEPSPYDGERYEQVRRIAAEMLADPDQLDADGIEGLFASQYGHATPKLDVRGAVFRDEAILLVEEAADLGWSLPGGWVDVGESPSDAVEREVLEESGYRTRATKLIGLYERDRRATRPHVWAIWKAAFLCELVDGEQLPLGAETTEARFFAWDELPRLRYSRASEWQVERCFAHRDDPSLPTEFD